jgi:hypothetical protein
MIFARGQVQARDGYCLVNSQVYILKITTFCWNNSSMLSFPKIETDQTPPDPLEVPLLVTLYCVGFWRVVLIVG